MSGIELLPWSDDDLWAVERFLTDPEMMQHLGGPQSREQALEQHGRFLDAGRSGIDQMFKIVLPPGSDAIGNIGYWDKTWREELTNLGEHEFEYPAGHPLQCNDWRLDLSLTTDHLEPPGNLTPTYHQPTRGQRFQPAVPAGQSRRARAAPQLAELPARSDPAKDQRVER